MVHLVNENFASAVWRKCAANGRADFSSGKEAPTQRARGTQGGADAVLTENQPSIGCAFAPRGTSVPLANKLL